MLKAKSSYTCLSLIRGSKGNTNTYSTGIREYINKQAKVKVCECVHTGILPFL